MSKTMENFGAWMAQWREGPPLMEQVRLAQTLCNTESPIASEATPSPPSPPPAEETAASVSFSDHTSLVSWKGIRVEWFLHIFLNLPEIQRFMEFGCELWFIRNVGVIELLRRRGIADGGGALIDHVEVLNENSDSRLSGVSAVEDSTVFVSYTGSYTLRHFATLLEQRMDPNEYMWTDTLCVNQFTWNRGDQDENRAEVILKFKEEFMYQLQGQIRHIGKTVLMLERWDDLMQPLGKIWVLWEIYSSVDDSNNLDVLLSLEQSKDFVENCLAEEVVIRKIGRTLGSVDANKAQSRRESDRELILNIMQKYGVFKVNRQVIECMRKWLVRISENGLKQLRQSSAIEPEKVLGIANNLVTLYGDLGLFGKARSLCEEVLRDMKQLIGENDVRTIKCQINLANILDVHGEVDRAEMLLREAMDGMKQKNGDGHPETLQTCTNLANLLQKRGGQKLDEAECLLRETLRISRVENGNEGESALIAIHNLATLLHGRGQLEEAKDLYDEAYRGRCKVLGPRHLLTLTTVQNLAMFNLQKGNDDEAEVMLRDAVNGMVEQRGGTHPDTLDAKENLAKFLFDRRRDIAQAEPLCRQVVEGRLQVVGRNHPKTVESTDRLVTVFRCLKKWDEAESFYRHVLSARNRSLGPNHPHTLATMTNLGLLMFYSAQHQKSNEGIMAAERMLRASLEGYRRLKVQGPNVSALNNLNMVLKYQGKATESMDQQDGSS